MFLFSYAFLSVEYLKKNFELKGKLKLGHHRSWWISCVHLKYPWRSNYSTIFESSTYIFHHHHPRSFICLSLFLISCLRIKYFFLAHEIARCEVPWVKKTAERKIISLFETSVRCSSKYNPSELKCYNKLINH